MKQVTITAHHMVDGQKVLAGTCVENKPENIDELRDQFEDDDIINLVWASFTIKRQRELVAEATKGQKSKARLANERTNLLIARAKQQKADGDPALYDNLVACEVIKL